MTNRNHNSKTAYVTEKKSKWSKLSNQDIINCLLKSTPYSRHERIFGKKRTLVVGSAVYKWILREEPITDIDAICVDTKKTSKLILMYEPSAKNGIEDYWPYGDRTKYDLIEFTSTPGIKVDLISYSAYVDSINKTGLSMANALVLTDEGIRHVLEVDEIKHEIALATKDAEAEREWMIRQIKAGKYCVWAGMRDKDKLYFKNWETIDHNECAMHGIYHDKVVNKADLVNPDGRSRYGRYT